MELARAVICVGERLDDEALLAGARIEVVTDVGIAPTFATPEVAAGSRRSMTPAERESERSGDRCRRRAPRRPRGRHRPTHLTTLPGQMVASRVSGGVLASAGGVRISQVSACGVHRHRSTSIHASSEPSSLFHAGQGVALAGQRGAAAGAATDHVPVSPCHAQRGSPPPQA